MTGKSKATLEMKSAFFEASGKSAQRYGYRTNTMSRFHRHEDQGEEVASGTWLISFTDVMALTLTFFVLLFSMSEPEDHDWNNVTNALQKEFGRFEGGAFSRGPEDAKNLNKVKFNTALNLAYLEELLRKRLAERPNLSEAELILQDTRLIVSLPTSLLFESGQAVVSDDGRKALYDIADVLRNIKNALEIAGHADPTATGGGIYSSNWSLSLDRALNVSAVMERVGYKRDVLVRGHASGRFQDLEEISDFQKRMDLARRVDLVLLDHDGSRPKVRSSAIIE